MSPARQSTNRLGAPPGELMAQLKHASGCSGRHLIANMPQAMEVKSRPSRGAHQHALRM